MVEQALPYLLAIGLLLIGAAVVQWQSLRARQRVLAMSEAAQARMDKLLTDGSRLHRDLMTESGRARALLRRTKAPGHDDGDEIEVPDWLVNVAQGAGIDVGKIMQGDQAELQKVHMLLPPKAGTGFKEGQFEV